MNQELFYEFDSLAFEDILIVPGYREVHSDSCVCSTYDAVRPEQDINLSLARAPVPTCAGAASLEDLGTSTRFRPITCAGLTESHPRDMIIVKEAPNYQLSQRSYEEYIPG